MENISNHTAYEWNDYHIIQCRKKYIGRFPSTELGFLPLSKICYSLSFHIYTLLYSIFLSLFFLFLYLYFHFIPRIEIIIFFYLSRFHLSFLSHEKKLSHSLQISIAFTHYQSLSISIDYTHSLNLNHLHSLSLSLTCSSNRTSNQYFSKYCWKLYKSIREKSLSKLSENISGLTGRQINRINNKSENR